MHLYHLGVCVYDCFFSLDGMVYLKLIHILYQASLAVLGKHAECIYTKHVQNYNTMTWFQ